MKIVFCGPPHSGKSVFLANLLERLPSDSLTILRACPDGEGNWSNNGNQSETSMVRKKGKFTQSFIDDICKAIDSQTNQIVLVDVGGIMSKENEQVFNHCDSFVVLSSDAQKKDKWLEFGTNLGLECIACLDSSQKGNEEIYENTPYLQGRIVGLERGKTLQNSQIMKKLASDILKKSKYVEKAFEEDTEQRVVIEDAEIGSELGYVKEIQTEDGKSLKQVKWREDAIAKIYQAMPHIVKSANEVKVNGVRANYALVAICKACDKIGVPDISTYDVRSNKYIPIKHIETQENIKSCDGLKFNMLKRRKSIFIDIDITKEKYSFEDYEKCVLPKIDENKNLYLSGRLPNWLLASIIISYDANKIFTFQPGKGFTCVSSNDEKDLGKIEEDIPDINNDKYFKKKKLDNQASEEKSLIEVPKKGILNNIKGFFAEIKKRIISKIIGEKAEQKEVKNLRNTLENITILPENLSQNINTNSTSNQTKINTGKNSEIKDEK